MRPPGYQPTAEEATQLAALRRLAGVLGIHFLEEEGDDLVDADPPGRRRAGITYVFVGTPDERRRVEILRGSLLSRMVRELPGVDIRVVADRALREQRERETRVRRGHGPERARTRLLVPFTAGISTRRSSTPRSGSHSSRMPFSCPRTSWSCRSNSLPRRR